MLYPLIPLLLATLTKTQLSKTRHPLHSFYSADFIHSIDFIHCIHSTHTISSIPLTSSIITSRSFHLLRSHLA